MDLEVKVEAKISIVDGKARIYFKAAISYLYASIILRRGIYKRTAQLSRRQMSIEIKN